eukprot:TRINITY_DN6009_c0_g1_i1.p2 TRINITY_DN6009_c0_g1~~TRINITY_DN6009_c0_g1_i1.p2  ORF type:complete len:103 (-),score=15.96 TRINITY_DN6009_c0_g1_i1:15-299(-)
MPQITSARVPPVDLAPWNVAQSQLQVPLNLPQNYDAQMSADLEGGHLEKHPWDTGYRDGFYNAALRGFYSGFQVGAAIGKEEGCILAKYEMPAP